MKNDACARFHLEHYLQGEGAFKQVPINRLPFRLGRATESDYVIPTRNISKVHAELYEENGQLHVRDLNSTNGTYVNGLGVRTHALEDGDILQLAAVELRVMIDGNSGSERGAARQRSSSQANTAYYQNILSKVLRDNAVRAVFQPIITLATGAAAGYEALGRALTEEVCVNTSELFAVAELTESAAELSRAFRQTAFRDAAQIPGPFQLFVNVHPQEVLEARFIRRVMESIAPLQPRCQVVLEIHEEDLLDAAAMRGFHQQLRQVGLRIAYDDFGAGRSRLNELAEAPPDFLKLDMKLIRNIDSSLARQEMLKTLRHLCRRLKITMIAEGLETRDEADACQSLGCELGQGYLFARPQAVGLLGSTSRTDEVSFQAIFQQLAQKQSTYQ